MILGFQIKLLSINREIDFSLKANCYSEKFGMIRTSSLKKVHYIEVYQYLVLLQIFQPSQYQAKAKSHLCRAFTLSKPLFDFNHDDQQP
jgi:hypothetical protein